MKTLVLRFAKEEAGVTAIEYGLIASLIYYRPVLSPLPVRYPQSRLKSLRWPTVAREKRQRYEKAATGRLREGAYPTNAYEVTRLLSLTPVNRSAS